MTLTYSIVMEKGPTGLSAYVPELPTILVTGGHCGGVALAGGGGDSDS
jgi:hypothetical protein